MSVLVCFFVCCPYYCTRSTYTFGGCTHLEMAHAHYFGLFVPMRPASTLDARAHRDGDIAYAPNPAKNNNSQCLNFDN